MKGKSLALLSIGDSIDYITEKLSSQKFSESCGLKYLYVKYYYLELIKHGRDYHSDWCLKVSKYTKLSLLTSLPVI